MKSMILSALLLFSLASHGASMMQKDEGPKNYWNYPKFREHFVSQTQGNRQIKMDALEHYKTLSPDLKNSLKGYLTFKLSGQGKSLDFGAQDLYQVFQVMVQSFEEEEIASSMKHLYLTHSISGVDEKKLQLILADPDNHKTVLEQVSTCFNLGSKRKAYDLIASSTDFTNSGRPGSYYTKKEYGLASTVRSQGSAYVQDIQKKKFSLSRAVALAQDILSLETNSIEDQAEIN